MKLFLMRHGQAEDKEGKVDTQRHLVDKGRARSEMVARHLAKSDLFLDLIVTSPLARAKETAEIVQKTLKCKNLMISEDLVPQAQPLAFYNWLKIHADDLETVLAVGHEPQLSLFASWLLTRQSKSFIEFKKSGVMAIDLNHLGQIEDFHCQLLWLISPQVLEIS